jgi:hypothetical protein
VAVVELVPVVLGVLIGGAAGRASSRWAVAVAAVLAAGAGATWSLVAGELAEGWLYAFIDAAVVMASALVSGLAIRRLGRRAVGEAT